jgi:hypothetical protein
MPPVEVVAVEGVLERQLIAGLGDRIDTAAAAGQSGQSGQSDPPFDQDDPTHRQVGC